MLLLPHRFLVRRCTTVFLCGATLWAALFLFCDRNPASLEKPLSISVAGDSVVVIHDTLTLRISVPDAARRGVRFSWFIDDPDTRDTTADSILAKVCLVADTGSHFAVVTAFDRDGIASQPDTVRFNVVYVKPILTLAADTIGFVNIPFVARLIARQGVSPIERYEWFLDNPLNVKSALDTAIVWTWKTADTGTHLLVVRAIDRDGLRSSPDSLSVRVTYTRPRISPLSDTTIKINDSLVLYLHATDSLLPVISYSCFIDDTGSLPAVTDSAIRTFWRVADTGSHRLIVSAVNSAGIASAPDTSSITVTCRHPRVRLLVDSAGAINDTCVFSIQADDSDGAVVEYHWSIDSSAWTATPSSTLAWTFVGKNAAGMHSVRAFVIDNDGLLSDTSTAAIWISLLRPTVSLRIDDTTIYAGQTLRLKADAFDTNGVIAGYQWFLDGQAITRSAQSDSTVLLFAVSDTGTHHVSCAVIDDDSLESLPDSTLIRVLPGTPTINAMNDTALSSLDSVVLTCTASDPNGSIIRYLWNTDGSGWNDSTAVPEYRFWYSGQPQVRVLVAALDNDGLYAIDTIQVTFNRPPDSITLKQPLLPVDTCWLSIVAPSHTLTFEYECQDPDGDSILYTVSWGNAPDTLVAEYKGYDRTCSLTLATEGIFYWKIDARDSWGNVRTMNGAFVAMREYRICFIGHSIVAGMGGNDIVGGFRGGVLDSLRKTLPVTARLKTVGTVTTLHMSGSTVDDTSLAIDGITAKNLARQLDSGATSLTADIWVFLIGANDAFNFDERNYTNLIMDTMIARNSNARIYVCNSPPLSASFTVHMANLPGFNQFIADSVAEKSLRGAHMFRVDAFTTLTTNGQYNQAWYNTDGIHPNQTGYNRLVDTIFALMKNSVPPAIPIGP
jgi:lysophospholipase L1-like esterase